MRNGTEDDAVIAVASNNWVAERLISEGDAASKKLCADLLKKFEGLFEKVSPHENYGAGFLEHFHFLYAIMTIVQL